MRFTDLFIRRPVLAIVVNLLIIIAGVQAIRSLNVRQYPRSENAAITVTTAYVGATADLVRGFVTTPLERVIAAADGIEYIESESKQNSSVIRARLRLNYDSTKALAEISSKVDQVRRDLPPRCRRPDQGPARPGEPDGERRPAFAPGIRADGDPAERRLDGAPARRRRRSARRRGL